MSSSHHAGSSGSPELKDHSPSAPQQRSSVTYISDQRWLRCKQAPKLHWHNSPWEPLCRCRQSSLPWNSSLWSSSPGQWPSPHRSTPSPAAGRQTRYTFTTALTGCERRHHLQTPAPPQSRCGKLHATFPDAKGHKIWFPESHSLLNK